MQKYLMLLTLVLRSVLFFQTEMGLVATHPQNLRINNTEAVATTLRDINTEGHKTFNLLPVYYSYGRPLSIATRISINPRLTKGGGFVLPFFSWSLLNTKESDLGHIGNLF